MVTPLRIEGVRNYFKKGPLWARHFARQKLDLENARRGADRADRRLITHLLEQVSKREHEAQQTCDGSLLWKGRHPPCQRLGDAFFSTGLLPSADPMALRLKPWGRLVFSPLQYPYREGVWRGPLIVVVDEHSASASELFAAELQDGHAAVIIGSPTDGAGCGATDGGTPTRLSHSGGVLELPDCLRTRADGRNLANGIQPDILVGFRENDTIEERLSLLNAKLDLACDTAMALETGER